MQNTRLNLHRHRWLSTLSLKSFLQLYRCIIQGIPQEQTISNNKKSRYVPLRLARTPSPFDKSETYQEAPLAGRGGEPTCRKQEKTHCWKAKAKNTTMEESGMKKGVGSPTPLRSRAERVEVR
ncbi:hypothetical protein AVEN_269436-1 [Araneus ventricosus]|uniref:Uncharacterized protein n=1 Tax=Araneus ventricosus TaxID=182803 RepID=A0A4Y2JFK5_ARAVE|nr:hypothetical protein AVEN_269436-1 [Araneus ventricosus]